MGCRHEGVGGEREELCKRDCSAEERVFGICGCGGHCLVVIPCIFETQGKARDYFVF